MHKSKLEIRIVAVLHERHLRIGDADVHVTSQTFDKVETLLEVMTANASAAIHQEDQVHAVTMADNFRDVLIVGAFVDAGRVIEVQYVPECNLE